MAFAEIDRLLIFAPGHGPKQHRLDGLIEPPQVEGWNLGVKANFDESVRDDDVVAGEAIQIGCGQGAMADLLFDELGQRQAEHLDQIVDNISRKMFEDEIADLLNVPVSCFDDFSGAKFRIRDPGNFAVALLRRVVPSGENEAGHCLGGSLLQSFQHWFPFHGGVGNGAPASGCSWRADRRLT